MRWHTFTSANGLAGNIVQTIWEDPEGGIWFGTENGVSRYDGQSWEIYRTSNGLLDNNVWAISGDEQTVWFATSSGVSVLHVASGGWTSYTTDDGLPSNDVRAVQVSRDGTVWVGTFGDGIGRKLPDSETWQRVDVRDETSTSDMVVNAIWESSGGAIWFGTSGLGALRFAEEEGWQTYTFARPSSNTVWSIGPGLTETGVSLATFRGIVFLEQPDAADDPVDDPVDDPDASPLVEQPVDQFVEAVDIADTEVLAVAGSPGEPIWFGTRSQGVLALTQGHWQHFTVANGLRRNYVQTIVIDTNERVWFGTRGGGVTLLDRQSLFLPDLQPDIIGQDVQNNIILSSSNPNLEAMQNNLQFTFQLEVPWLPPQAISYKYWLQPGDTPLPRREDWHTVDNTPASFSNARTEVFAGLPPGTYTLHVVPEIDGMEGAETSFPFTINSAPPNLSPDTIQVVADNNATVERGLTLPQRLFDETRQVRLEFSAEDDETAVDQLEYLYKVETLHSDWQTARGAQTSIALPQGEHMIQMQAIDADGNRSKPAIITVIVPAPLWKTILVALLLILLPSLVSSMVGAYGYQRWARRQALLRAVSGYVIPYDVGPLITPDRYIGRQHVVDTVMGKIDNNSFYIWGEKRIGKTSLLLQLKHRLLQRNSVQSDVLYVPVFRNMQDLPQDQFWIYLIRSIAAEMRDMPPALTSLSDGLANYDDFDAEGDLEAIVAQMQSTANPRQLYIVLLLDEVDTLQRYDPTIRQRFRAFCQHMQRNVRVVLAGVLAPSAEQSETSPWYNIFEPIKLEPLANEDTLFLIRNYNHNPYLYTPEAEQAILTVSAGRPYLTQWLCSEAVKAMLAAKRTRVTLSDVQHAVRAVGREHVNE
jgi:hypothetical protein